MQLRNYYFERLLFHWSKRWYTKKPNCRGSCTIHCRTEFRLYVRHKYRSKIPTWEWCMNDDSIPTCMFWFVLFCPFWVNIGVRSSPPLAPRPPPSLLAFLPCKSQTIPLLASVISVQNFKSWLCRRLAGMYSCYAHSLQRSRDERLATGWQTTVLACQP